MLSTRPANRPIWLSRATALGALAAMVLAGCAVGPNFKAPAPPSTQGYVPGGLPAATSALPASLPPAAAAPGSAASPAAASAGGQAQNFVNGLDIPGQWWTL